MRIMVIDDEADMLRSLELLLAARGHAVTTFDGVDEACVRIAGGCPTDLVIVDWALRGDTAETVLAALRATDGPTPPVMLISAHSDVVQDLNLARLGIAAYLPKPIDLSALYALVDRLSPPNGRQSLRQEKELPQ